MEDHLQVALGCQMTIFNLFRSLQFRFFFVLQTLRRDVRICEPLNNLWIFVCCLSFMLVHVKSVILGIS